MNQVIKLIFAASIATLLMGCGDKNSGSAPGAPSIQAEQPAAKPPVDVATLYKQASDYRDGLNGAPYDREKARELFTEAAERGERDSMYFLGMMYENGEGGPVDEQKALEWIGKSAATGNGGAIDRLKKLKAKIAKREKEAAAKVKK